MTTLRALLAGLALVGLLSAPAQADDRFDRLVKEVERIRGLSFKQKVPWEPRTQEGMGARFKEEAEQGAPSADDRALSIFLFRLGLAPRGFDVQAFMASLLADQVRGLYDPSSKTFLVVAREEAKPDQFTTEEVVAVHELQHALQDQYFDLGAYTSRLKGARGSDEALAGRSVVEGEAELVGTDFMLGASGMSASQAGSADRRARTARLDGSSKLASAPLFFRRLLSFPYTAGMDLVLYVRKAGGWDLVGRMYEDPPISTEQVMHPERYLDQRDPPIRVLLNLPAEIAGYSLLAEDVGGEFMASVFLEDHLGYAASVSPAKGWGGDTFRVYARGDEDFALWYLHWDSMGEASQFARAAKQAFAKAKIADAEVVARGQDVVLYLGVPPEARKEIAAALERVTLDPDERRVVVKRPEGGSTADAASAGGPEIKENRYLLESDRFVSLTHGFVLPVPEGWVPQPNKGQVTIPVTLVRLQGSAQAAVHVVRLPKDPSKAPPTEKERATDLFGEIRSVLPGAEQTAVRSVPGPAGFLEVEAASGSRRLSVFRGEALGRTYTVMLRAGAAEFPAARKELVGALKAMTFRKPGEL